ncbi:hypothetical protein ERJ75_000970600 [Trypanosoma vivax]|nr:hypothetical protein ERJ75_000970600 [Trypanosoma vivax]
MFGKRDAVLPRVPTVRHCNVFGVSCDEPWSRKMSMDASLESRSISLSAGKFDDNETGKLAAQRETAEELGISRRFYKLLNPLRPTIALSTNT